MRSLRLRSRRIDPRRSGHAGSHSFAAVVGWLCLLGLGSAAHAQTDAGTTTSSGGGTINARLLTVDGEEEENIAEPSIGVRECTDDVTLEFELNGIPDGKESIDIYTGDACNGTNRNNVDINCDYVTTREITTLSGLEIEIQAGALSACDGSANAKPTFWFLAVTNPESMEDVGTGFGEYKDLRIDLEVPDAPDEVTGGSGENQIPVRWESDESDVDKFIVLIDSRPTAGSSGAGGSGTVSDAGVSAAAGAEASECGSDVLRAGASADSVSGSVTRKTATGASTSSLNLRASDIDGDRAAVAVVAVDRAGNESVLSNVACVQVVPTEGFWDRYEQNGGGIEGGCPCAAIGPAHARTAWPIGLALGYLAWSARRRRRS